MTEYILVVHANPIVGRESEFADCYDQRHLADMVQIDGVASARRYELRDDGREQAREYRSLAIYELEGDPSEVMAKIAEAVETGQVARNEAMSRPPASAVYRLTSVARAPRGRHRSP